MSALPAATPLDVARRMCGLANSYTRMYYLMELRAEMPSLEWFTLLGEEWAVCDNIGRYARRLRPILRSASETERAAMMAPEEQSALKALPEVITVYRGCYARNHAGLSWTLNRDVATRFPFLARYRQPGTALLVTGRVRRDAVVLKLDRQEQEIITAAVRVVGALTLEREHLERMTQILGGVAA